jgi:hypothetical protein
MKRPRTYLGVVAVAFVAVLVTVPSGFSAQGLAYFANPLKDGMGTNLNWTSDGDGLHLSDPSQPVGVADSLIRSLGYHILRIPGGYLARTFDWQKAAGGTRGMERNIFSGHLEPVTTGLPEMKRFAAKYGFRVMYTLNLNDSPQKVVQLLDTWNALPPADGPHITWVELGNEVYDSDPTVAGAHRYVDAVRPIMVALKAKYPTVRMGALIANPVNPGWDTTVYEALAPAGIDFLIWHRYVPYIEYRGADSYESTLATFAAVENDMRTHGHLQTGRRVQVFLTEYNLSFYDQNHHPQSPSPLPRYYLLLGNFVYLGMKYRLQGLVKEGLSNPGWHYFADIDHGRDGQAVLGMNGIVSRLLDGWVNAQDSVALVPQAGQDPYHVSAMAGESTRRVALLVQNHDSVPQRVSFSPGPTYVVDSTVGLEEHGTSFWAIRQAGAMRAPDGAIIAPPYSITVVTFRSAKP